MGVFECARCGHIYEAGAGFCDECGARTGGESWPGAAPAYGAPAPVYAVAEGPRGVVPLDFPVRPFETIGDVLGPTARLYREHFIPVGKVVLSATLPLAAAQYVLTRSLETLWLVPAFATLSAAVVTPLMTAALIYAVAAVLRTGEAPSLAGAYGWALRKWWKVLACWLLAALIVGFGFILLIIPGIILMLATAVALPAVVLEDRGPMSAVERSFQLTRGYRGMIFVTMFLVWVVTMVLTWLTTPYGRSEFNQGAPPPSS